MPRKYQSEAKRLESLHRLKVLDTSPEKVFDGLVAVAAAACGVPISLISLIDSDRQWFKANLGLSDITESPREVAFCSHTIQSEGTLEVRDATADPRFADNPLVTGAPDIRFYAGHPLRLSDGALVGTLCVIDRIPRELSKQQRTILAHLANAAAQALEARRTNEELHSSEAQFRALCDASPIGIFSTDDNGACTYTNAPWQSIFDMSAEQALGFGWSKNLHPQDQNALIEGWQQATSEQTEFRQDFRTVRTDKSVCHARVRARPVTTSDGKLTGHVGTVEDITDQIAEKTALQAERTRLESIIDGTGAGTWEWNYDTGEVRLNERWAAMTGRTLTSFTASAVNCNTFVHPDDLIRAENTLNDHFSGKTPQYEVEVRVRHVDGYWIWVLDRGRVITHTATGKPQWLFGTRVDINKRKLQEQALRRNEQLLAQTGSVANTGGWEFDILTGELLWTDQTSLIHALEPGHRPSLAEAVEYYAPKGRPAIREAIDNAIKNGIGWDLELPLIRADGNCIWVRSQCNVELDGEQPVRLIGALQDITERTHQIKALENAHERITVATQSGNIGVWDLDVTNNELSWSLEMFPLYGIVGTPEAVSFDFWVSCVHQNDREMAKRQLQLAIDQQDTLESEFRVQWPDGSIHHLKTAAQVKRNAQGKPTRVLGVNWDITPIRQLTNELAEQHELLRVTLQSIGDAVITTDATSQITWLNPVAEQMTGWTNMNAIGCPLTQVFNVINEVTREPAINPVDTCLNQGDAGGLTNQTILISRNGKEYGIEESASPIRSVKDEILGAVLVFHDVTETRRLSVEMNYRATHDPLTNLTNRSEFEARLQRTLDRAHESNIVNALLYIDLDQFKLVNDTCGHTVGDQLLQQIAKLLSSCVRSTDTLARLGGDEFGVILQDCSTEHAQRVAQKMCDHVDKFRFTHHDQRFRISTSIGLVPYDNRWDTKEAAMQAADTSCYTAKDAGRNRVHMWFDTDENMRARRDDVQWATRLEEAIDENRFVLHAQRISPVTEEVKGLHAEVLIRLLDHDGNIIPPGKFLPAAERFHLATRIDRWVLQQSINYLLNMTDISKVGMLCVNLSGQSVGDKEFHREAIAILNKAGTDICKRLCVEITETAAVTNIADATTFVEQIRQLGVRVALDDFGSGASSFGYLKMLNVDLLKIDGQFITGMIEDKLDAVAVRCFVEVAAALGLKTVAEFVKSQEILDHLATIGVDYAQGYLLHKPDTIETVLG